MSSCISPSSSLPSPSTLPPPYLLFPQGRTHNLFSSRLSALSERVWLPMLMVMDGVRFSFRFTRRTSLEFCDSRRPSKRRNLKKLENKTETVLCNLYLTGQTKVSQSIKLPPWSLRKLSQSELAQRKSAVAAAAAAQQQQQQRRSRAPPLTTLHT